MTSRPTSATFDEFLDELAAAPPLQPSSQLKQGERIGKFEVQAVLGHGGFGVVYLARDPDVERDVAIKLLRKPADETEANRVREAALVARLVHPGIVTLHECGRHAGHPYLVFERLVGETLRRRLERGALRVREALNVSLAVADALAYAHARGIIHRDLKPDNVFLCADGRVKLLDFGLAHSLANLGTAPRGGTPGFVAPEQARGEPGDARSDIFSAGMLLAACLQGAALYANDPRASGEWDVRRIPSSVRRLVQRATAEDPQLRPADGSAWQTELRSTQRRRSLQLLALPAALLLSAALVLMFTRARWSGNAETPLYTVTACPGAPVNLEPLQALEPCSNVCPEGHCLANRYAGNSPYLKACPGGESKCVPDVMSGAQGRWLAQSCVSSLDARKAGRCMPKCLLNADPILWPPRDGCRGSDELCAPCEYPAGQPTGACDDHCVPPPRSNL